MAVISTQRWMGEPIKLEIKFNSSTIYTVYSDSSYSLNTKSFIQNIKFHIQEGNNNVNPLGIAASNSVAIKIYDEDNDLNPCNTGSPYYGMMVNGIEINAYISYDGTNWEDYGTFFVTSWSGEFSDGSHGLVYISAEDRLNSVGNMDMPYIPVFNEISASDLITYVFDKIGITTSEFEVDSSVNQTLGYAVIKGNKIRDFLNNICQLLLARVIIDRHNKIRFVLALNLYNGYNTLTIGEEYTGTIKNKINTNIDYSKVKVKYLSSNGINHDHITDISNVSLVVGQNTIGGIIFDKTVMAIDQVDVVFNKTETDANVTAFGYTAYQNGMTMSITVETEDIEDATIRVYGTILETKIREIVMDVHSSSVGQGTLFGGRTFEFDTKQLMNPVKAGLVCVALKNYVNSIGMTYTISGSALTPKLYTGDKLILSNTGTIYDAAYKIISADIEFGENYNFDCTLLKLAGV